MRDKTPATLTPQAFDRLGRDDMLTLCQRVLEGEVVGSPGQADQAEPQAIHAMLMAAVDTQRAGAGPRELREANASLIAKAALKLWIEGWNKARLAEDDEALWLAAAEIKSLEFVQALADSGRHAWPSGAEPEDFGRQCWGSAFMMALQSNAPDDIVIAMGGALPDAFFQSLASDPANVGELLNRLALKALPKELLAGWMDRGFDINAASESGKTMLSFAALGRDPGHVQTLLRLGANPNIRSADGSAPLPHVLSHMQGVSHPEHVEIALMLIEAGADPFAPGYHDLSAWDLARAHHIKAILEACAPIKAARDDADHIRQGLDAQSVEFGQFAARHMLAGATLSLPDGSTLTLEQALAAMSSGAGQAAPKPPRSRL